MKPGEILVGLSSLFKDEDFQEILSSLHFDPKIWEKISEDGFLNSYSEKYGADPSHWTPGSISLFSIDQDSLSDIVNTEPLQPIPQELRQQASAFFQKVLKSEFIPTTLSESAFLALALRERKRLTGTWDGLVSEIIRSSISHTVYPETWQTPFSILFSWFNKDTSLLKELNQLQDTLTESEYYGFLSHIVLTQQFSLETKTTLFYSLFGEEDFSSQVNWLKYLSPLHPSLAQILASKIISSYQEENGSGGQLPNGAYNHFLQDLARQSKSVDPLVSEEFDPDFTSLDQWITLFGIARDDQQYDALVEYKKDLLNTIQSGIQAYQLKKNISSLTGEAVISEWREISEKAPQSDVAKAEYTLALLKGNRKVNQKDISWGTSEEPLVLLTRAQLLKSENNSEEAKAQILKAIEKCLEKRCLSTKELERYTQLINVTGFPELNKEFLQRLSQKIVTRPDLYRLQAANDDLLDSHSEAIDEAKIALALDWKDNISRRMLAKLYEKEGRPADAMEEWKVVIQNPDDCSTCDLLDYSNCAISANQPDDAISTCETLLLKEPANGDIYSTLGDAYSLKGDSVKAAENYHRSVTISPERDHPWIKLVEYQLASGDKDKTIDLLSTAINACPNSAPLASMLGDYYIEEGSYAESIPYLKKAFTLDTGNPQYALKLGTTLQNIGQSEESISVYQDALAFSPDNISLLDAYTNILIACSRNSESVEPLLRLIAQHPADIKPYLDLTTYALSNRDTNNPLLDLESIEPILQEGLQLDPENITGRLLYADLLAATNREELAKDIYVSLSEDVNLPIDTRWKVNYGLGVMSTKLGQIDIALAALEEAGSQNPSNFEIHHKLAETYASANLPKAAIESAQAALAIAPADLGNLIWYSEFCTKLGDIPEALSSLDAAIKQQPDRAELRIKLGELQLRMKDVAAAKKTFQNLVAHGKLNANLIQQVAKNLVDAGELDEAIHYLEFGIDQDPVSSLPLLLDLVKYEQKTGNMTNAVASIDRAIAIDPENIGLQVIKADLLSHSGQYEQAISALEDTLLRVQQQSDPSEDQIFELLLRLIYLNRANGESAKALSYVEDAIKVKSYSDEALFLGADISFNILDFSKAGEYLHLLFQSSEETSKPISLLSGLLNVVLKNETEGSVASAQALSEIELPAKWSFWRSAADFLLNSSKANSPESDQILDGLVDISAKKIYQDLPLSDYRSAILPQVNVYNPILTSPTLLYMLVNAALSSTQTKAADSLVNSLASEYSFEPSTQYYLLKNLTIQAELYRNFTSLKIKKHLPTDEALSVSRLDQFNEALLNVKRYSESEEVKYWEMRGLAAFHKNIENLEALLQIKSSLSDPKHEMEKMALENNLTGLEEITRRFSSDIGLVNYAAGLIKEKAPAKAFEWIENNIDAVGNNPTDLALIALTSYSAGEYEIAMNSIEKALSKWPNEPAWHGLAAQICKDLDNPSSALYHLKIAADLEPENFDTVFALGEGAFELGDPVQALQYLKVSSSLEPTDYRPWFLMAKTYQSRGDNLQALANVERAVTLAPNKVEPLILSAELSYENGQPEQAIKKVDSAIRIDPKNVEALVVKVRSLKAVDQSHEAMKLIDYSIKKVSKPLPLLVEKAEMIRSIEGEKAYLNTLQKIADDYPKNPDILRLYSLALAENGYPTDALNITQLALKLNPDQSDMHILAGRLLRSTGQLDQALDHLSQAITQEPGNMDGYLEFAKTYQERRDFSKAVSVLQQAIEMMPKDYRPYYQLGLIMKDSKDYHGAESMLRKAADLSRDDVNILRQLGAIIAINLVHPA